MVVPEVLVRGTVEGVRSGLGDHAYLPAGARAVFGRVVVRLDAKLLHVLETGLQAKRRIDFAVQNTRLGVDHASPFDAVIANRVLLHCPTTEADRAKGAIAAICRARRLQEELGDLAAIEGKPTHFAKVDVDTETPGNCTTRRFNTLNNHDRRGNRRELPLEITKDILPHGKLQTRLHH